MARTTSLARTGVRPLAGALVGGCARAGTRVGSGGATLSGAGPAPGATILSIASTHCRARVRPDTSDTRDTHTPIHPSVDAPIHAPVGTLCPVFAFGVRATLPGAGSIALTGAGPGACSIRLTAPLAGALISGCALAPTRGTACRPVARRTLRAPRTIGHTVALGGAGTMGYAVIRARAVGNGMALALGVGRSDGVGLTLGDRRGVAVRDGDPMLFGFRNAPTRLRSMAV